LPLTYAEYREISLPKIVTANTIPTLFIQAEHDPVGSSEEVTALTTDHGTCISVVGDNHDYADIAGLVSLIDEFVTTY